MTDPGYIDIEKARRERDKARRGGGGAPQRDPVDDRPVIQLHQGDIELLVDDAEAALISSDRGLYQRAGKIVAVGEVKITVANNGEGTAQRIVERGDFALVEDLTTAASFQRWDGRSERWVVVDAPMKVAKTLKERGARLRLPVLAGITNAPTIRPDGSLLDKPGYDEVTGLLFDPGSTRFPTIPDRPTEADGIRALFDLEGLFSTMPFASQADKAVAVSAVITACSRNAYPTAPLHAVTAPTAGSGKSMIIDAATMVATGRRAAVLALGKTAEETEKRLAGALMSGDPVLALDNCEIGLGSDLLCQILTQPVVRLRALGGSAIAEMPTNIFVSATGNNLVVVGDMTRRTVMCKIDPRHERPELRVFTSADPVTLARRRRGELVAAALIVLRAYVVAGRPPQGPPVGSFEGWSRTVRDAMLWLGSADPVISMEEGRKSDPKLEQLKTLIAQWRAVIGLEQVTAHQVIDIATRKAAWPEPVGDFKHPDLRDSLLAVAGDRGAIVGKRLGAWLGYNKDRVVNGCMLKKGPQVMGIQTWQLFEAMGGSSP